MPTLDWIGKKAVVNHHREVPFHLLKCDAALSVGDPGSGNLLVQGDNLLALKALLPYYAGRVKCIYIDPPYNTGNENWVYNDAVNSSEMRNWLGKVVGAEAEDLSRHDKWLCMMYPRLSLLREFLRSDGAIFVSIADHEIHTLRMLMDEVFGPRNFVATVIWQKVYSPKNSAKHFSEDHDYIVVYARDAERWRPNLVPRAEKQDKAYKNPDNDPRGPWKPSGLDARNPYSKGVYPITCPSGRIISGPPKGAYWRYAEDKFKELDADNRIWWGTGNIEVSPEVCFGFDQDRYAPNWYYEGAYRFRKHYFPLVGELKSEGEEFVCAVFLDQLDAVSVWVRNLERRSEGSFWLQTSSDKFYPDFVALLTDGRILVVEYKGEDRWSNDDSREKRAVGELWADRSNGRCLFIMPKGPDLAAIEAIIRDRR